MLSRFRRLWFKYSEVRIVSILMAFIVVESVLFWFGERRANPALDNPLEALWCITLFLFSGADIQPSTAMGRLIAILVILEGVVIVTVFTAFVIALRLRGRTTVDKKKLTSSSRQKSHCLNQ